VVLLWVLFPLALETRGENLTRLIDGMEGGLTGFHAVRNPRRNGAASVSF